MKVDLRKHSDIVIVDLEGKLVAGTGDELLGEVCEELLTDGWRKILLNLSSVPYIDSSGVGALAAVLRTAEAVGASISATRLGERAERVLRLSHLLPLLRVFPTEEDALAELAEQPLASAESTG